MDTSGNLQGGPARAPNAGDTRIGEARVGEGMRMGERDTPLRLSPFRMLRVLDSCRPPGNRIGESHHCHLHDVVHFSKSNLSSKNMMMTAVFNSNIYEFDRWM